MEISERIHLVRASLAATEKAVTRLKTIINDWEQLGSYTEDEVTRASDLLVEALDELEF